MTTAQLLSPSDVPFRSLVSYHRALMDLQRAPVHQGPLYREYAPTGLSNSGHDRHYFTPDNAQRIDGMRRQIADWWDQNKLTAREHDLLLADLMSAANSVANIAGTYGCFLRHWSGSARRTIALAPRTLRATSAHFNTKTDDVFNTASKPTDVIYLDPPYTKRQYAAYYHVLETLAYGDHPQVDGVTGLRSWKHLSSPFCHKRKALNSLQQLIVGVNASSIFLSYSQQGHISIAELESALSRYYRVDTVSLADIARYCPNDAARAGGEHVTEYLIRIEKQPENTGKQYDSSDTARENTSEAI